MRKSKRQISVFLLLVLIGNLVLSLVQPPSLASAEDSGRKRLDVRKTMTAPVIDGRFEESFWSLSETLDVPLGEGLASPASLGLLWDNQYLYVGMELKDDRLISEAPGYWFQQDSVSLFFDPTLHGSAPFVGSDMQAGFVYQPDSVTPLFHFGAALNNHQEKDEKQILRAIRTTGDGWTLEVAVPWSMLGISPVQQKRLGFEATATDRYGADAAQERVNAWSAFGSDSFWNDTTGYGVLELVDENPVSGVVNPVLLEENFDSYGTGTVPYGWISDVQAGSPPFSVTEDSYGNKSMTFSGTASGQQARITAPVQWDNYTIEADVRFDSVLNPARWAALMFRGAADGKAPYNQMAVRQNGTYEVAYRKPDNAWSVIASGASDALELKKDYSFKVRVFGNNVKEYIKAKEEGEYKLLVEQSFDSGLLDRGKVGFQADQSTVSFDNLKVTRITVDDLRLELPPKVEALTGPLSVTGSVYFSDGLTEPVAPEQVAFFSSDETVLKVSDGKIYPLKEGTAVLTAIYANAEWSREVSVQPGSQGVKVNALSHEPGYALAETGKAMALSELGFSAEFNDFTTGTLTGADLQWSSPDASVLFENGKMTAQRKGVHLVTGQKDGVSISLLVVTKDQGDAEYVLYENNFEREAEGGLPAGWTKTEGKTDGKAAVKGGAFVIDASTAPDNPTRVALPEYLQLFGNYGIEADVTHLAANEPTRWHSVMYRIQNNSGGGFPYYQMAVRQNATAVNGVEFAERTPDNAWNVMGKGTFGETLSADKMYHYAIDVYGDRVMQSIDGQLLVNTDQAGAYLKGGIGLQANGSVMKVDNLRVTLLQTELPPLPEASFVNVAKADTSIALAPSVVAELGSKEQLNAYNEGDLPATLIIYVDKNMQVTTPNGNQEIANLEGVLDAIDSRIMPAFYVKDAKTASRLTTELKSSGLEDAFIVSDRAELVDQAREAYPMLRGIVDFSGAKVRSNEDLMEIRKQATRSQAKIVILPQEEASEENVAYLQQRTIVVWTKEAKAKDEQERYVNLHRMITAGTNGMITGSPGGAYRALKVYSNNTTLIRKPYMIGHRGMPSVAPENTIISNRLALDAGADFIENDIFLSKDGHLVIIHDSVVDTTTYGTGRVENMTLEELRRLKVRQVPGTNYPEARIATLEEQIDLARERGAMIYAEIKTNTPAAVDAFVKLVKAKNAEDLINVMSFDTNQLDRLAAQLPDMPVGLLTGGYANENRVNGALRETLKVMQRYNSTLNTSYGGLGPKFMDAAHQRGLIVSPWTYNNHADFKNIFMLGAFGITTDYAFWAKDWDIAIEPEMKEVTLKSGDSLKLSAFVESYSRTRKQVEPDIVLLDDRGIVTLDQKEENRVLAQKAGTAYALLRYTASIDTELRYDIYTEPVQIKVIGNGHGNGNGSGNGNGNGGNPGIGGSTGNGGNGDGSGKAEDEGNNGKEDNGKDPLTEPPSSNPLKDYSDIQGHWASEAIELLSGRGIMEGYEDGTFKPDRVMTRAEFIAVISRLLGLNGNSEKSKYTDVSEDSWYLGYVNGMAEAGIVSGFGDGTFRPEQPMTREEVWVILYRAFKNDLQQKVQGKGIFTDKNTISPWAREAVPALIEAGAISGYPDGTLKPKESITRAEAATLLAKWITD